ncbi:hypothetical protein [Pseudomonas sp. FW300-N1A1]|uniref:hypothetical protein n=1 Tax=Pseudomonas sp. FW300-N1A1 TaxID=2075555 RepID=UPI001304FA13|nr:hypothetical protein [Pseudomonas sp. FW300-N1A1]
MAGDERVIKALLALLLLSALTARDDEPDEALFKQWAGGDCIAVTCEAELFGF